MGNNTDVGSLFIIIMGSLIGAGTIALGITSYNLNSVYDNTTNKPFVKKDDDSDSDSDSDKTTEEDIMDLSNNFNFADQSEVNDRYSIGYKGTGGKRKKHNKSNKNNKRKTSSRKNN